LHSALCTAFGVPESTKQVSAIFRSKIDYCSPEQYEQASTQNEMCSFFGSVDTQPPPHNNFTELGNLSFPKYLA